MKFTTRLNIEQSSRTNNTAHSVEKGMGIHFPQDVIVYLIKFRKSHCLYLIISSSRALNHHWTFDVTSRKLKSLSRNYLSFSTSLESIQNCQNNNTVWRLGSAGRRGEHTNQRRRSWNFCTQVTVIEHLITHGHSSTKSTPNTDPWHLVPVDKHSNIIPSPVESPPSVRFAETGSAATRFPRFPAGMFKCVWEVAEADRCVWHQVRKFLKCNWTHGASTSIEKDIRWKIEMKFGTGTKTATRISDFHLLAY